MGTKKFNLPSVYIFQNTCQITYFRSQWLACLTQERTIHSYGVRRNTDGIIASTSRMRQLIDNWQINRLYQQSTRCLRCVDDSDFWRIAPWPRSCLQSGRGQHRKTERDGLKWTHAVHAEDQKLGKTRNGKAHLETHWDINFLSSFLSLLSL